MKKFVVSYVNFHDNTLVSKIVYDDTVADACHSLMLAVGYISPEEVFETLEELEIALFDRDILVNGIEI